MNEILKKLEKLLSLSEGEREKIIELMKDLRINLIEQSGQTPPWIIVSSYIMVIGEYAALTGFPKNSTILEKMFAAGFETGKETQT